MSSRNSNNIDASDSMQNGTVLVMVGVGIVAVLLIFAATKYWYSGGDGSCNFNNNNNINNNNENFVASAPKPPQKVPVDMNVAAAVKPSPIKGTIIASKVSNNKPYDSSNNGSGDYAFTLLDQNNNVVTGDVKYAYSFAENENSSGCMHITPSTYSKFTYTVRNVFTILGGTLCVSAIAKDQNDNLIVYANASFNIVPEKPVEVAAASAPEEPEKKMKKDKKSNVISRLLKKSKKEKDALQAAILAPINDVANVVQSSLLNNNSNEPAPQQQ